MVQIIRKNYLNKKIITTEYRTIHTKKKNLQSNPPNIPPYTKKDNTHKFSCLFSYSFYSIFIATKQRAKQKHLNIWSGVALNGGKSRNKIFSHSNPSILNHDIINKKKFLTMTFDYIFNVGLVILFVKISFLFIEEKSYHLSIWDLQYFLK